jgi:hypothetical protein
MFEREDWTLFRTVEGLQQKAGVAQNRLRRLVLKELYDNALDTETACRIERLDTDTFAVSDEGPGIDGEPVEIAALFSIRRPMRSSKLLRLPQRGALGNGLRVVAGAVLASGGDLVVETRNRQLRLRPEHDGSTTVLEASAIEHPVGTRVEIRFGEAMPHDPDPYAWVRQAIAGQGEIYGGKTSPFWYDAAQFHELLLASGAQPVRALVARLDGCSGGKAGKIVEAVGLSRITCAEVTRADATALLEAAREEARPVRPERLGFVGSDLSDSGFYAIERGEREFGSAPPRAKIPFVAEAWIEPLPPDPRAEHNLKFTALVNRTPVTAEIEAYNKLGKEKGLTLFGCGLEHRFDKVTATGRSYAITMNITTPYMPITSDGKAPDLDPFASTIAEVLGKAMRKARRNAPKNTDERLTQKQIVLDNLDAAVEQVSGSGIYRFNERQVLYVLRPP